VNSITPASGATNVSFQSTITINLSQPLAPGSTLPAVTPPVPGGWTESSPTTLVFRPTAQLAPFSTVRVSVPGGPSGIRDTHGAMLASTVESSFTVQGASVLRLQQVLAELEYLPVTFVHSSLASPGGTPSLSDYPLGGGVAPHSNSAGAISSEPTAADEVPLAPLAGHFTWRFPNTPQSLESLWVAGQPNVMLVGAVMAFESAAGLAVDGDAGPAVWRALLTDVAARKFDASPYNYLMVSETLPETLTVWQDGKTLLDYPANTGITAAPTATGTYPVYARYLTTTMSGTEPNGHKYKDPGIPWVSYFNGGDAVHGYIRPSYGYPQSLGCVELSYADAQVVFNYDPLGTLVTVSA
jgi:peptidoglycan hydrolase-like protein with peptidoglycan-binding domain